jgi:hypothetical protein
MKELKLDQKLTANQLYKQYKDEGGTLSFSSWLNREKTKGIFPLNEEISKEIVLELDKIKKNDMNKTVLGFPKTTLYIVGGVIVLAIIASQLMKKK